MYIWFLVVFKQELCDNKKRMLNHEMCHGIKRRQMSVLSELLSYAKVFTCKSYAFYEQFTLKGIPDSLSIAKIIKNKKFCLSHVLYFAFT